MKKRVYYWSPGWDEGKWVEILAEPGREEERARALRVLGNPARVVDGPDPPSGPPTEDEWRMIRRS